MYEEKLEKGQKANKTMTKTITGKHNRKKKLGSGSIIFGVCACLSVAFGDGVYMN